MCSCSPLIGLFRVCSDSSMALSGSAEKTLRPLPESPYADPDEISSTSASTDYMVEKSSSQGSDEDSVTTVRDSPAPIPQAAPDSESDDVSFLSM